MEQKRDSDGLSSCPPGHENADVLLQSLGWTKGINSVCYFGDFNRHLQRVVSSVGTIRIYMTKQVYFL